MANENNNDDKRLEHVKQILQQMEEQKKALIQEIGDMKVTEMLDNPVYLESMRMIADRQKSVSDFMQMGMEQVEAVEKTTEKFAEKSPEKAFEFKESFAKFKDATFGRIEKFAKDSLSFVTQIKDNVIELASRLKEQAHSTILLGENEQKRFIPRAMEQITSLDKSDMEKRLQKLEEQKLDYFAEFDRKFKARYEQVKDGIDLEYRKKSMKLEKGKNFYKHNPIGQLINKFSKDDKVQKAEAELKKVEAEHKKDLKAQFTAKDVFDGHGIKDFNKKGLRSVLTSNEMNLLYDEFQAKFEKNEKILNELQTIYEKICETHEKYANQLADLDEKRESLTENLHEAKEQTEKAWENLIGRNDGERGDGER